MNQTAKSIQLSLFGDEEVVAARGYATSRKQERSALDELFEKSQQYRRSKDYLKLMEFMGKFREHAPFNLVLLHTQNPNAQYVMTAGEWELKFRCRIKRNARPCVILWPFAPVHFVYDVQDVEPISNKDTVPIPEEIRQPFRTEGVLQPGVMERRLKTAGAMLLRLETI